MTPTNGSTFATSVQGSRTILGRTIRLVRHSATLHGAVSQIVREHSFRYRKARFLTRNQSYKKPAQRQSTASTFRPSQQPQSTKPSNSSHPTSLWWEAKSSTKGTVSSGYTGSCGRQRQGSSQPFLSVDQTR